MILIPCESAMSVICKVKIPPQMTIFRRTLRSYDNIRLVRISISVIWPAFGGSYIFFQGFCFLWAFLSIFRKEWSCVGVFDSILGAVISLHHRICRKRKLKRF